MTVIVIVTVAGKLKLGNFHASFTDLAIPVAGIPITDGRIYDTLDAQRCGDFGFRWRLDVGDFELKVAQPGTYPQPPSLYQSFRAGTRVILPSTERTGIAWFIQYTYDLASNREAKVRNSEGRRTISRNRSVLLF